MNCTEFRGLYSDFVDGLLDETGVLGAHRHVSECQPCRRFHESVQWGVRELRRQPQLLPSPGFALRVERAIQAEAEPMAVAARQGIAAAAVLMSLTVVAAGMFAFDLVRHSQPPRARTVMGPLPVLGANAFQPTFRYVTHSVATTAPFATAHPAAVEFATPVSPEPVLLLGGSSTR